MCEWTHYQLFIDLKEGDLLPWFVYFVLSGSVLCKSTTTLINWLETTEQELSEWQKENVLPILHRNKKLPIPYSLARWQLSQSALVFVSFRQT